MRQKRKETTMKTRHWTRLGSLLLVLAAMLAAANCGNQTSQAEGDDQGEPAADTATGQEPTEQEKQLDDLKKQVAKLEKQVAGEHADAAPATKSPKKAVTTSSPAPAPAPRTITLPQGTPLMVRTTTEISTKSVRTGDSFVGSLEEPLTVGGVVVAPKGADVTGVVANANPGGRVKGRAELELRLRSFREKGGQAVNVSTNTLEFNAEGSKKKDAVKVGIATGIGAAIGAIAGGGKGAAIGAGAGAGAGTGTVLLTRGDAAVLPAESVVSFLLTAPVEVTARP